jgi:hypothetical protein
MALLPGTVYRHGASEAAAGIARGVSPLEAIKKLCRANESVGPRMNN